LKTRRVRRTLLVVGEGQTETAFLGFLRSLYCADNDGVGVTIRNAKGRGPSNVIGYAVKIGKRNDFDRCVALLDTDIPWKAEDERMAKRYAIRLIGSNPCVEGLFLSILGERVPEASSDCKKAIRGKYRGLDLTRKESYAELFDKGRLEAARGRIDALDELLRSFEGQWKGNY
jgi:hypothetical protein